ncbi:hypothetical protein KCP70_02840 [Salmonella enterica subsp. enterica]|nr:hypothetical protein KCP70_02840 [Salmonella enterica subsp. enterica]
MVAVALFVIVLSLAVPCAGKRFSGGDPNVVLSPPYLHYWRRPRAHRRKLRRWSVRLVKMAGSSEIKNAGFAVIRENRGRRFGGVSTGVVLEYPVRCPAFPVYAGLAFAPDDAAEFLPGNISGMMTRW